MNCSKKITNSPTTTVPKLQKEIEKYRSITLSDDEILDFELLPWWCSHIGVFPILAKIARAVFAVPATAAHIERVWRTNHNINKSQIPIESPFCQVLIILP